jgi:hypothetical protein
MSGTFRFRSDRNSGGLFASTVVLTVALFGALFVGMLSNPGQPMMVWGVGGGGLFGLLLLVWLLRDRPNSQLRDSFGWLSRRPKEQQLDYDPRLIKSGPQRFGTNQPPTAAELRELKDTDRNWVPSNATARKSVRRR